MNKTKDLSPSSTKNIRIHASDRLIKTTGNENLLSSLAENSILLRSDCGGKGTCGKCLVNIISENGTINQAPACTIHPEEDIEIDIPDASLFSAEVITKPPITFPQSFTSSFSESNCSLPCNIGIAIDLGTTTIAFYLMDTNSGRLLASTAVKNPQSMFGDDVVSRIGFIGESTKKLRKLQLLAAAAINWGISFLLEQQKLHIPDILRTIIVGNPTMLHILLGVSPAAIGVSPYTPEFYSKKTLNGAAISKELSPLTIETLPQLSGFIGGDLLAAATAYELDQQDVGTLILDLGTNGELILKTKDGFLATSCATGPAFEGATLSCGIQAISGAIDSIKIGANLRPSFTVIPRNSTAIHPVGICGSGIISGVASLLQAGIVLETGAFDPAIIIPHLVANTSRKRFIIHEQNNEEISISQKDIRHIQLGKSALITGINALLQTAQLQEPTRIIVTGGFGAHLNKYDLLALGMLPSMHPENIYCAGNGAGAGAAMALCNDKFLQKAHSISALTTVLNLADDSNFQMEFIRNLSF